MFVYECLELGFNYSGMLTTVRSLNNPSYDHGLLNHHIQHETPRFALYFSQLKNLEGNVSPDAETSNA